jgi:RNA polymerase sigma-70 factor (ECF subfamily)
MHALYARHNVKVYRFILRLTGNPTLADDLVSEVFLDVWRQAAAFRGRSQVSTWLLAIARNKTISALRRRCDERLDEDALAMAEDPGDNPEIVAEKEDRGAIVQHCLARLSPNHREVLDLVYYHDKSVDETAEIVGIPVGTVKTRMHYARNKMKAFLALAGVEAR